MPTISRRTALRGLGVSLALPWLEAMGPLTAWAGDPKNPAPNRMCFCYVPNGKNMPDWTPKGEGTDFELPAILEPLKPVRERVLVLTGLTADKARPHGDGGGDHARHRLPNAGPAPNVPRMASVHSAGARPTPHPSPHAPPASRFAPAPATRRPA